MKKFTQQQIEQIILDYKELNLTQTGKKHNISKDVLYRIFKEHSIPIKGFTEVRAKVKINPFINLEDAETQYWLGWLATDGGIFRYTIKLSLIDKDIVENFSKFCGTSKVRKNIPKNTNHSTIYSTEFSNKFICEYLEKLGITKDKSSNLQLQIPLTWPLILGIIEGDGWVYRYQQSDRKTVGIGSASSLFIDQIKTFLEQNNVKCNIHIRSTNGEKKQGILYVLTINKKESIEILKKNLYNITFPILKRKII